MSAIPQPVQKLIDAFSRLPGIGPRTAARLTYYLLHAPAEVSESLANAAQELKIKTRLCSICKNVTEEDPCAVCADHTRDQSVICVVESPLDVVAIAKSGAFTGLYHVLHGSISPLQNIGPDELFIAQLLPRLKEGIVKEVILATNPSMEGEATAMYVKRLIAPLGVTVTRIARGLPVGGDVEYADEVTLRRALEGRREF